MKIWCLIFFIWMTLLNGICLSFAQVLMDSLLTALSTTFDSICSTTINIHQVPFANAPDIRKIKFQYIKRCENISVPILDAQSLWQHPDFTKSKKVIVMATGWRTTVNTSSATPLIRAFLCRPEVAFVMVDMNTYVDTMYKWAALNTDEIGSYIAKGLRKLVKLVPLQKLHLIGHSLGAHIMGAAGRHFHDLTGKRIPRITGLDPAKPCFQEQSTLQSLSASDAQFVDIIHTNTGIASKLEPLGHIDFYPNGLKPSQPGCTNPSCSHGRAIEYFAESVYQGNDKNFIGIQCPSIFALQNLQCNKNKIMPMGYKLLNNARGIYYMNVNASPPYGAGARSSKFLQKVCYQCPR